MSTYASRGAELLRSVTSRSRVVWAPTTGWVDDDRCPRCGALVDDHAPFCPDPDQD